MYSVCSACICLSYYAIIKSYTCQNTVLSTVEPNLSVLRLDHPYGVMIVQLECFGGSVRFIRVLEWSSVGKMYGPSFYLDTPCPNEFGQARNFTVLLKPCLLVITRHFTRLVYSVPIKFFCITRG